MKRKHWTEEEWIYVPPADEVLVAPIGTEADLKFLRCCKIEEWDSFNWICGVNGDDPFGMSGTTWQKHTNGGEE